MYKLDCKKPQLFILLVLMSYASINALFFSPALPAIQDSFHISTQAAQSTITIFLIGYAIGPLFYGPLANRFGRKKTLYIGVILSLISALASTVSAHILSYSLLMWSRFFMAIGSSVGITLTFMIIADYYYPLQARKKISYVALAFAVVPGIAIALGGLFVEYLGWISSFYFLTIYALLVLFFCTLLPETGTNFDVKATQIGEIIKRYKPVVTNLKHFKYSMMGAGPGALVYIFATGGPIVGIKYFHLPPFEYGLLNLIPYLGYFFGGFLSSFLNHRLHHRSVFRIGYSLILLSTLVIFLTFVTGNGNVYTFFIPAFFMFLGMTSYFSNSTVLASEQSEDKSTASSWMSFVVMGVVFLSVFVMSFFNAWILISFPLMMLLWAVLLALFVL
ncbi:MAG: Multidrug resistance protein MdtL [Chlamydiia bacterium]|nr:Multidrug resistance protein MdtL [Chlamydiia bacterium]MCH9615441.1 Multidrug resistance protein MdtL [Chlamydiia bacterium]MCH9628237.1 Multidrug resistance protein MdtL [Chlamydiia bacterium]